MTRSSVKIVAPLLVALLSVAALAEALPSAGAAAGGIAARDSNLTFGTDQQFDTGGIFWRMMLALLLVLVLGIAVFYASRKLSGRITSLPGRQIRLIETFYLGSRKTLHLVKVGDRSILVGTTPTTLTATDLGCDNQSPPPTTSQE